MWARISKLCEYQYFRFSDDRKIFKSQLYISLCCLFVPVFRNVIPVTFILVYAAKQMLCLIFFIHTANPTLFQMWLILPLLVIISTQCLSSRYAISYYSIYLKFCCTYHLHLSNMWQKLVKLLKNQAMFVLDNRRQQGLLQHIYSFRNEIQDIHIIVTVLGRVFISTYRF